MSDGERFTEFLDAARRDVERELERRLPAATRRPARLHEAMRYSVFAGGKRLRPALVLLAGETFGAPRARLLAGAGGGRADPHLQPDPRRPAGARRRRPAARAARRSTARFDEATAILAGDALLTAGADAARGEPAEAAPATRARAVALVGEAIGTGGMIGGQVEDLEAEARLAGRPGAALERIHRRQDRRR